MSTVRIVNGFVSRKRKVTDPQNVRAETSEGDSKSLAVLSSSRECQSLSLVDPIWETLDPTPDVYALFMLYNDTFFYGALGGCEVRWSPRMTSCAGICSYEGRGGLCTVRLSKPLLILRPRRDLVETLLHEMIHAYLFVTARNRDRDGHGPEFQLHMHRINAQAGTRITIYHSFFAEVANYKQHWWRCEGPCRDRRPYFGWVKRASNRAPGPNDYWWSQHQQNCGGRFVKLKEPEGYRDKKKPKNCKNAVVSSRGSSIASSNSSDSNKKQTFPGPGHSLGIATSSKELKDTFIDQYLKTTVRKEPLQN